MSDRFCIALIFGASCLLIVAMSLWLSFAVYQWVSCLLWQSGLLQTNFVWWPWFVGGIVVGLLASGCFIKAFYHDAAENVRARNFVEGGGHIGLAYKSAAEKERGMYLVRRYYTHVL